MIRYAEFTFNKNIYDFFFSRNTYSYLVEHSLGNASVLGSCKEQVLSLCLEYTISQRREDIFWNMCVEDR